MLFEKWVKIGERRIIFLNAGIIRWAPDYFSERPINLLNAGLSFWTPESAHTPTIGPPNSIQKSPSQPPFRSKPLRMDAFRSRKASLPIFMIGKRGFMIGKMLFMIGKVNFMIGKSTFMIAKVNSTLIWNFNLVFSHLFLSTLFHPMLHQNSGSGMTRFQQEKVSQLGIWNCVAY